MNQSLDSLRDELRALDEAGLRRTLRVVDPTPGATTADGRAAVLLCSNDYLALATDPEVAAAAANASLRLGAGSGAARLVTGTRAVHQALERDVARFCGTAAALTFSSGYAANVSTLSALLGPGDLAISDALNHASLIDGLRLSGAERRVVPHGDASACRAALRDRAGFRRAAIVVEGLHSMDGDVAPLADLATLAADAGAFLIVDDAHGLGVLGGTGRGAVEAHGLPAAEWLVRLGTFGKAFGASGAFVAAARDVVDAVMHRGRGFVFSTAPAPGAVAAAAAGLAKAEAEPWRRERCLANAGRLRDALRRAGVRVPDGPGPIVPLVVGDSRRAVAASERLLADHGFVVTAIRPPTVPVGTARLRVTTHAALEPDAIDRFAVAVAPLVADGATT